MRLFLSGICLSLSGWVLPMASALANATASSTRNEPLPCRLLASQSACFQRSTSGHSAVLPQSETLMAQGNTVQITDVRIELSESGFKLILNTPSTLPVPATRAEGKTLIADIPNATLLKAFQQTDPIAGMSSVTVTNLPRNQVRIAMTGTDMLPKAEIRSTETGLTLAVITGTQTTAGEGGDEDADEEELVVTGEQDAEYRPSTATTATKTDTPLRDIPQSIQVVPNQVIKDQGVTEISDAVRNVSGVAIQRTNSNSGFFYNIRGFEAARTLRDGFEVGLGFGTPTTVTLPNTIERVEVLKGPASVLYGNLEPGGLVNLVTKQPLSDLLYSAELTVGQFNLYQPSIDLSGPLTADKKLLYRLNAAYQNFGSFVDFVNGETVSIAPTLRYNFSDKTSLTLSYDYSYSDQVFYEGLPSDPVLFDLPVSRFLNNPDGRINNTTHTVNATFEHKFNENISLRSSFGSNFSRGRLAAYRILDFDVDNNNATQFYRDQSARRDYYSWQNDLTFKFKTGPVQHQLLAGVELARKYSRLSGIDSEQTPAPVDLFNPAYYEGPIPPTEYIDRFIDQSTTVGVYLQDQMTLLPNLKVLIGGRYDFINATSETDSRFLPDSSENSRSFDEFYDEAFSPRVGIVYQPIKPISLYASFSQSFVPNNARTRVGDLIEPTRGTQYEVGIKAEITQKLAATLSAYQITKTNIPQEDPVDSDFQIPIGEVRSRGIEFDISGEILPGWNIFASAFLNDSVITEGDQFAPVGSTLTNAPRTGASLWSTYEIQKGVAKGLGFGFGVFYIGDREAEVPNDFVLPSYVRADASLFYRRKNWSAQLNFRNLFNTQYYESSGFFNTFPGAPFTVTGTVSVRF
jgi:iron complex outermembrane recepter protein